MIRFTPVSPDTPEAAFVHALATELAIEGFDPCGASPLAIGILAAVQAALDADDLQAGIRKLVESREWSDRFWIKHHPRGKRAKAARERAALAKGEAR